MPVGKLVCASHGCWESKAAEWAWRWRAVEREESCSPHGDGQIAHSHTSILLCMKAWGARGRGRLEDVCKAYLREGLLCQFWRAIHLQALPLLPEGLPSKSEVLQSAVKSVGLTLSPQKFSQQAFPFDDFGNVAEFITHNSHVLWQSSDDLVNKMPYYWWHVLMVLANLMFWVFGGFFVFVCLFFYPLNKNRNYTGCDWDLEKAAGRLTS